MTVDSISLHCCSIDDAAKLALVGAATFLEAFAGVLDGDSILLHCQKHHAVTAYEKYLSDPNTEAWLAVVQPGNAPVGYAMLTTPDLPILNLTADDIELKRIYIFSRFRTSGAGQVLLDKSLRTAREKGRGRLLLGVHAENHRALSFYRKNGFEQVGVRTFQVGHEIHNDLVLGRAV